jgi:hypothetical protein
VDLVLTPAERFGIPVSRAGIPVFSFGKNQFSDPGILAPVSPVVRAGYRLSQQVLPVNRCGIKLYYLFP